MDFFDDTEATAFEANLLIVTVAGDESPLAYKFVDGRPQIDARGVELCSSVNVELLITFLRSKRPIGKLIRDWLADMLDPNKLTSANLFLKRRSGQPKKTMLEYREAVEAYVDRRDAGDITDVARENVVERFRIKEGSLRKAITALEKGIRIHRASQIDT